PFRLPPSHCLPSFHCRSASSLSYLYSLSLHDALPIYLFRKCGQDECLFRLHLQEDVALLPLLPDDLTLDRAPRRPECRNEIWLEDRKSTRLNSSHEWISYAVFCLKKKKPEHVRRGRQK